MKTLALLLSSLLAPFAGKAAAPCCCGPDCDCAACDCNDSGGTCCDNGCCGAK